MKDKNTKSETKLDEETTIADMSMVERRTLLIPKIPGEEKKARIVEKETPPWVDDSMSSEERRWAILGAVKAALVIAIPFILGLGAIILAISLLYS